MSSFLCIFLCVLARESFSRKGAKKNVAAKPHRDMLAPRAQGKFDNSSLRLN
jgi:hypothetical protein